MPYGRIIKKFSKNLEKLEFWKNSVILCLKSLPNRFGSIFPQIGGGVCHMVAFSKYFWINWKNKHFWEFWYFMLWMPQQPSWGLSHGSWGRGPDFRISLSAPPLVKGGGCNYFYSRSITWISKMFIAEFRIYLQQKILSKSVHYPKLIIEDELCRR